VSQISPPVRILLVLVVAAVGVYMLVLRPKSPSTSTPAPAATPAGNIHTGKPAVTTFGKIVQSAQGAAKATEKQTQNEARNAGAKAGSASSASGSSSSSTSSATATKTAAVAAHPNLTSQQLAGLPKPVAHALRQHKVLALLFANGHSADDVRTRAALRKVMTFEGAVYVHAAPLSQITRYAAITQSTGADVQQSPTIVVIDRDLKARTLVGFSDSEAIDQVVIDSLRASGGIFTDPYLRRINSICSGAATSLDSVPAPARLSQAHSFMTREVGSIDGYVSDFRAVPAPARWSAFRRAQLKNLGALAGAAHTLERTLGKHPSRATLISGVRTYVTDTAAPSRSYGKRMDAHDLVFCGTKS
jgi:hypothetical protein